MTGWRLLQPEITLMCGEPLRMMYVKSFKDTLEEFGLSLYAISNHSTGQCVCDDPIDFRHRGLLSARTWGDGDPEGVRQRAADEMKVTAVAAARVGASVVTGFTGSRIWPYVAMYPPVDASVIDDGYQDFADRWNPIIDAFEAEGVKFALEVHPSEIAYDYWTTSRTLDAIGHREGFGINWDPSHMKALTPQCSSLTSRTGSTTCTARTHAPTSMGATAGCRRICRGAIPGGDGDSCQRDWGMLTSRRTSGH